MNTNAESVRNAFGYLFPDELVALREIVKALPENPVIINIGAGAGTSGLLFLETRDDTHVTTIDIQDESSPFGCLEGERQVVEAAGLGHLMGTRWKQICGRSQDIGIDYWGPKVDFVFVDGGHSYDDCYADIDSWAMFLKPGGVIAVHDYKKEALWVSQNPGVEVTDTIRTTVIKPYPGVDKATDDFLKFNGSAYTLEAVIDSLAVIRKSEGKAAKKNENKNASKRGL